jgi:hypothetical protein
METAAAIILKALVDNNAGLKAKVNGLSDPRMVEEVLKPYYRAALSLVKKVSSGEM